MVRSSSVRVVTHVLQFEVQIHVREKVERAFSAIEPNKLMGNRMLKSNSARLTHGGNLITEIGFK